MSDELKPVRCGCGGDVVVNRVNYEGFEDYEVHCANCFIRTDGYNDEAEAIQAWNKAMSAKDINVPNKNIVIVEPFTTDMNHVGYCKCGYLVNAEWKYCPSCSAKLEWSGNE